jgi:hypothetical protein
LEENGKGNTKNAGSASNVSEMKASVHSLAAPASEERLTRRNEERDSDSSSDFSEGLRISKERVLLKLNTALSQLDCQTEIFSSITPLVNNNVDNGKLAVSTLNQSLSSMKAIIQECIELFDKRENQWATKIDAEAKKNRLWEESLRALAIENHQLEEKAGKLSQTVKLQKQATFLAKKESHDPDSTEVKESAVTNEPDNKTPDPFSDDEIDEFFDAADFEETNSPAKEAPTLDSIAKSKAAADDFLGLSTNGYGDFRKELPIDYTQIQSSVSLWSFIKNAIGKDLSKITLPVNFNEPLGMLQRLAEDMEYSELIDIASAQEESIERILYVAAFAMSNYSSTVSRTTKPFNPLLVL